MKRELYAKVVGHELFRPDPKNDPKLELVKVKLEGHSPTARTTKRTKILLIMEREDAFEKAVLGTALKFTFETAQLELDLDGDEDEPAPGLEQERMDLGDSTAPAPPTSPAPAKSGARGRRGPTGVVKGGKAAKTKARAERVRETFRPRTPAPGTTDPTTH